MAYNYIILNRLVNDNENYKASSSPTTFLKIHQYISIYEYTINYFSRLHISSYMNSVGKLIKKGNIFQFGHWQCYIEDRVGYD